MPMQIINELGAGGRLGAALGTGLGSGLSQGLQLLAQQKLTEMARRQSQERGTTGLQALGFSPEESQALSGLDPRMLQEVVKQRMRAPQQAAYLQALTGQAPQEVGGTEGGMPGMPAGLTERQATQLAKIGLKREAMAQKERHVAIKETKIIRKDIIGEGQAAREDMMRLDQMEALNKGGKLDNPKYVSLLKKFHLDFPWAYKPGTAQFEKLTIDFLRNAKKIFGARITNFEAATFLRSIPSLEQTPEQRQLVIDNLKIMAQARIFRRKTMSEIIKESKGIPPFDLEERIEERISPQIDQLAKRFKENIPQVAEASKNVLFSSKKMPDASRFKGKGLRTAAGKILISNGLKWIKPTPEQLAKIQRR
jgi:hypothetical protein